MKIVKDYKCLISKSFSIGDYSINSIRYEDIMHIKEWRNSQLDILRQKQSLTDKDQINYFENAIWPSLDSDNPKQILVSFYFQEILIGYGGLVHISWEDQRGELSFLTNPIRHSETIYEKDFSSFIYLIKQLTFDDLKFNRIHGETYSFRTHHILIMEKCGFSLEGTMRNHICINGKYVDSLVHGCNKTDDISNFSNFNETSFMNILLTSVSKKIPLISNVRSATKKLSTPIVLYGGDSSNQCIGRFYTDDFWEMPRLNSLTAPLLINYCKQKNIRAIVPSRDQELLFFASVKAQLLSDGINIMISDSDTINSCLDKHLFYEKLHAKGFPVIPTFITTPDSSLSNTWVVKERFGAGSAGLAINIEYDEALYFSTKLQLPIFQPYISGREYSVDAYVTKSGRAKGIICRSRDLVVAGESQITTTLRHPQMEKLVSDLLNEFNFYGHIIFQIIEDKEGLLHIVECNPRFGGASTLAIAAGLDSFYWFLLESQGENINNHLFVRSTGEKRQIRAMADLVISV